MALEDIRPHTCRLLDLMDEGILDPRTVAQAALMWLEERDVKRMAEVNEFFADEEEEEDFDEGRDWGMERYDTSTELD